jgi:hypothetical protein
MSNIVKDITDQFSGNPIIKFAGGKGGKVKQWLSKPSSLVKDMTGRDLPRYLPIGLGLLGAGYSMYESFQKYKNYKIEEGYKKENLASNIEALNLSSQTYNQAYNRGVERMEEEAPIRFRDVVMSGFFGAGTGILGSLALSKSPTLTQQAKGVVQPYWEKFKSILPTAR